MDELTYACQTNTCLRSSCVIGDDSGENSADRAYFNREFNKEVIVSASVAQADVGVGARPMKRAEVIFDGTRNMLDEKWT